MKHAVLFGFLLLLFVFPLFVLVGYALHPAWRYPQLFPDHIDFRSLSFLVREAGPLSRHMGGALLYSLSAVVTTLVMCYVPARILARVPFSGRNLLEGFLLAPALVPPMTFAMGLHFMFIKIGLADTLPGVILVVSMYSYPYMLRALIAGFQATGDDYVLCAENLGAGRWTRLIRIEFPMLVPSIMAGGSVVFLVAFSEYFLVFLIGGGAVPSFTGYLFPLLSSSDRSLGSALTLVFVFVPLMLFVMMEWFVGRAYRRMGLDV
ncbi:MAG: ABC transporter permease subunit [Desulfoplanes sp.]|nr:ABC transporter permease subunit [Desulfoplanes sp.]